MNCPLCSSPLFFGATTCPCGYNQATSPDDPLPIELSYWESLRAYWRTYWPTQVVGLLFAFGFGMIAPAVALGEMGRVIVTVMQIPLGAVALFLFAPRICSRPYRGFSLVKVDDWRGDA
jgi:hypothetical protein